MGHYPNVGGQAVVGQKAPMGLPVVADSIGWGGRGLELDEAFVRHNDETRYLWHAADPESKSLEVVATKRRNREAASRFPRISKTGAH